MRAMSGFTLCHLLLLVFLVPPPAAAALLPSTVLAIQSNQSLDTETPSLTSALFVPPFPPFPPRPPAPPIPTVTRTIECFGPSETQAVAPNPKDCDKTIEVILHVAPGPMEPQNFSRSGTEGSHKIPVWWEVGNCQILMSSRDTSFDTWDMFRYVDIVAAAQDVLRICVPKSKLAFGGIEEIGLEGFYVAVNGLPRQVTGNVTEDGSRTNATSMGTGTAVRIALPTGASALVQGDGLDEDLALSVM